MAAAFQGLTFFRLWGILDETVHKQSARRNSEVRMDSDLIKVIGAFGGVALITVAIIFLSIPAPPVVADEYYSGSGAGYYWTINAEVGLSSGRIVSIDVTHEDTPGLADGAIETVVKSIISSQSPNVDTVSGATATSRGVIEAVTEALDRAGFSY
jgi:uncharacterized protein with FMN-binding domain